MRVPLWLWFANPWLAHYIASQPEPDDEDMDRDEAEGYQGLETVTVEKHTIQE